MTSLGGSAKVGIEGGIDFDYNQNQFRSNMDWEYFPGEVKKDLVVTNIKIKGTLI